MRSLYLALLALLTNNEDLTAAVGRPYSTQVAEIWNLPQDVTYPVLAIDLTGLRDTLDAPIDDPSCAPEEYGFRCWYETDTKLEAVAFHDALRVLLHRRQVTLYNEGVAIRYIEMRDSKIGAVPGTAHFQSYEVVRIVV